MSGPGADSTEYRDLRRCLRDLAAVTALPAVWSGQSRERVAEGVADVLVRVLHLDAACVQLHRSEREAPVDVALGSLAEGVPGARAAIARALQLWLDGDPSDSAVLSVPHPSGSGTLQAAVTPIGYGGEFGALLAASASAGFPTDEDRLLLSVVANQASVVLQRLRAEVAQALLAAIVESSQDAIVSKTLDGIITSWNAGAEHLFGYSADEAVGQPITLVIPPDRRHEEEMILARLRRGERIEHFETVRRSKEGRLIDISLTVSPVRDGTGRIIGASKVARDISAWRKSERTLRFLADASAALGELTDVDSALRRVASLAAPLFADWCAVDLLEPDGSVRRLDVTHRDPARVRLAHELSRRYPPRAGDPQTRALVSGTAVYAASVPNSLLAECAHDEEHLRLLRELGLCSYICVPIRARTKTLGALTFATAESGRSYSPDDLRAAEDLADRAGIAIENARLVEALQEADRRKDEFLATLAHELRNPLAPLRNTVHILRSLGSEAPQLQRAEQVIDRQVRQLARLVDDLLDVSRITRGKVELRMERTGLSTVVCGAVEMSRPLLDARGHDFQVVLPPEEVRIVVDPARLTQVLSNLLNNAARYTEPGGRIRLVARFEDGADGGRAIISVKDTGIGIPPEMLPQVFEMFTQVNPSEERSQGGLGIGLTLVKRLVELHGGRVEARSEGPGKGSEFVVTLPLHRDEGDPKYEGGRSKDEESVSSSVMRHASGEGSAGKDEGGRMKAEEGALASPGYHVLEEERDRPLLAPCSSGRELAE